MYSEELLQKKSLLWRFLRIIGVRCKMESRVHYCAMKEEFQLLVQFVDKLLAVIRHNRSLKARKMQCKTGEPRIVYEHDDLLRKLKKKF